MRMPTVLRMKQTVPSDDLGNPTIEQLYRMYNDESSIPIVRQQAELIVKLNALLTVDEINMASAGLAPTGRHNRAPSPASTSTSPAEDINPGFQGTSGRTASRQPQKVPRDDNWVPRWHPEDVSPGAPMSRARSRLNPLVLWVLPRTRLLSQRHDKAPAADFSNDDDTSLRPSGGGKAKGKGKSDKGKGK